MIQARRLRYAERVREIAAVDPNFWDHVIMSGEAQFSLDGIVNTYVNANMALHPPKVIVWCGVCSERVIGPYFFEDHNGVSTTVNGERYREMIQDFLAPELEANGMMNFWFQQDCSPYHTARETIDLLREMFPNRLISAGGDVDWPARSDDLTQHSEFRLWGYLEREIYFNQPQNLEQLKVNIHNVITGIPRQTLRRAMQNTRIRADLCENLNVDYLPTLPNIF